MKKQTRGLTFMLKLQIVKSLKDSFLNVISHVSKYWESEGIALTMKQLHNTLNSTGMGDLKHKLLHRRNVPLKALETRRALRGTEDDCDRLDGI